MATAATSFITPAGRVLRHWPIFLGMLLLVVPTIVTIAQDVWTHQDGVHGPIILATGIWLIWREWPYLPSAQAGGSRRLVALLLILALGLYVFGRAFGFLSLEGIALAVICTAVSYSYFGGAFVRSLWFPILYLCSIVPIPGEFMDALTGPLKNWISICAVVLFKGLDYPIAREGVTIFVAHYQLLVQDACAGLNSLVSLVSISLFYVYLLHRASARYALLLVVWIVPIAILANFVRVVALIFITYHWGDAAAQGFLHSAAGLMVFVVALLGIIGLDRLLRKLVP